MKTTQADQETGFLWYDEGVPREGLVAEVAPLIPTFKTYSFAVEPFMEESLAIGHRVMVPLGRRGTLIKGFVVSLMRRRWDSTLRPIKSLADDTSFLSPHLVELGREVALHFHCPLGRTLKAITPESVRRQSGLRTVRYAALSKPFVPEATGCKRKSAKRLAVLAMLAREPQPIAISRLRAATGASSSVLRALEKEGAVHITRCKELAADAHCDVPRAEPSFDLNDEQREALSRICERINEARFCVTLLYGVSGSGKTEVYIRAMRRVVEAGRQAILLVPEIVLTTQIVQRLASRFSRVAVSHSGLTGAQRSVVWRQVASGEKSVVIGTRSAVFAPCPNLGLICVDEEQESSYKNLQAPRFHVRDVAIMRAKLLNIPVVLGSATPSIETWHRSGRRADYGRLVLRNRVKSLPMPAVYVIDMRIERAEVGTPCVISRSMERLLAETLERGEQALILMNRRGFAYRLFCPSCRERIECPNCNVGLVVHAATGQAVCHYCRTRIPAPTTCPQAGCGAPLAHLGQGTQRVEDELVRRFPQARLVRVDSDTMKHRAEYQKLVDRFESRQIDVLVGTQMIAKGLDFPHVSFVGVVNADMTGLASDFRAHERLFQLITQVAGRAGRAETPGKVVVQTTTPDVPALAFALKHDYESFAAEEIEARAHAGLPPFSRLARVVIAHARADIAQREAGALAKRVRARIAELSMQPADVLGPSPCALSRLQGLYRFDLLLRTQNASKLRELLSRLEADGAMKTKAKSMTVDVDPVSLV